MNIKTPPQKFRLSTILSKTFNWISEYRYRDGSFNPKNYVLVMEERFNPWKEKIILTARYYLKDDVLSCLADTRWEIDFKTNTAKILESDYMPGPLLPGGVRTLLGGWPDLSVGRRPKNRITFTSRDGEYLHWNLTRELSDNVARARESLRAR